MPVQNRLKSTFSSYIQPSGGIRVEPTTVCHVTTVHRRYDTRIFYKQCRSLANNGYRVTLLVNDDLPSETLDNVQIMSTNFQPKNRLQRIISSFRRIKQKLIAIDAEIYHFHDPELLLLAYYMKTKGKIVVFDSHEDYVSVMKSKQWIPAPLRPIVSRLYGAYERAIVKTLDGAIVCYHWTEDRFKSHCSKVQMILNFPIISNNDLKTSLDFTKRSVAYAGGITSQWCHHNLLKSLSELDNVKYELAGKINNQYAKELQHSDLWRYVNFHGFIPHDKVYENVYKNSTIGLALLDYIPQCKGKIGNLSNTKLFEYMLVGLPVICTDFILWKKLIQEANCGICVNPHNVDEIRNAISRLLDNPSLCELLGRNGQKAVLEKYNWGVEEKKLLDFYSSLL